MIVDTIYRRIGFSIFFLRCRLDSVEALHEMEELCASWIFLATYLQAIENRFIFDDRYHIIKNKSIIFDDYT